MSERGKKFAKFFDLGYKSRMFFKLFFGFFLTMSFSHAAPLAGYLTQIPENLYRIVNSNGKTIYQETGDLVKRVELRDGLAVVQLISNHVSLIREDGSVLVDRIMGAELLISKKLFATYTKGGIGAVYTNTGKKLYPLSPQDRGRPIAKIWIANDRFAVSDQWLDTFTVYDFDGVELFSTRMVSKAVLSDGFLALFSPLGAFTLYDSDFGILTTSPSATDLKISDSFAAFRDVGNVVRIFSVDSGELFMNNQAKEFHLTNTFALVNDPFGWTAYGRKGEILETVINARAVVTSHELLAYEGITGALTVKNLETADSFTVNQAGSFFMSDDLILVKNGSSEYSVYSLNAKSFGSLALSFLNPLIHQYQVGNGVVCFETRLPVAPANAAQVYRIAPSGNLTVKSLLLDEVRVGKVAISVNREEWNWL